MLKLNLGNISKVLDEAARPW